jgi:hypothetical protein
MNVVDDSARSGNPVVCVDWKPFERNTLLGFAVVRIDPWQMTIHDIAIHQKNGARWAQLPAKPLLDRNTGQPLMGDNGRVRYVKIIEFTGRDVTDRFSNAVLDAVDSFKKIGGVL